MGCLKINMSDYGLSQQEDSRQLFVTATCAYCGTPPQSSKVTLWDGKNYCSACLENITPGLLEYATDHPTFEEICPGNMNRHEWPKGRLFAISGLLLSGIASASCVLFQAPTPDHLPYIAGVIALLTTILYLVLSPMLDLMVHNESTTIRIVDGNVEVQITPFWGPPILQSFALDAVEFDVPEIEFFGVDQAIHMTLPYTFLQRALFLKRNKVELGHEEKIYYALLAFLKIREHTRQVAPPCEKPMLCEPA